MHPSSSLRRILLTLLAVFSLNLSGYARALQSKDAGGMKRTQLDKLDQYRFEALSKNPSKQQAMALNANSDDFHNNHEQRQEFDSGDSASRSLDDIKQREAELARMLADIRLEKMAALRSRPLKIGIVGFGRFGQFIAKTFTKHAKVVVTSRSDYTQIADEMGAKYVPLSDPSSFINEACDVIVVACSILSFEQTIKTFAAHIQRYIDKSNHNKAPLVVDVLSVKEHPRETMLHELPNECDILCTHPMFGPDSGKDGWTNLNFVYEKTRLDSVTFHPAGEILSRDSYLDGLGNPHNLEEECESTHMESIDRVERFLSIWEEEGCKMVPLSCKAHDEYAANSQFITHLMGRILGAQGLSLTPIDTKGFESVLKLVDSTTADSFDLFYGLYKYNKNSRETIANLKAAMDDVVDHLEKLEANEQQQRHLRRRSTTSPPRENR